MTALLKKLTLQFMPFSEIDGMDSGSRIKKLLRVVLSNKIILLQGKLKPEEEARLIEDTMAMIGHLKNFKGVELAVLSPKTENAPFFSLVKTRLAKILIGERDVLTIIGPASIIREIRKDPTKIELLLKGSK